MLKRVIIKLFKWFTFLFLLLWLCSQIVTKLVDAKSKDYVYDSLTEIPANRVGLILGTSKYLTNGRLNLYYQYRIDAAVRLYKGGKIRYILISGDNGTIYYNEPITIKKDLMKRGIPEAVIYLDYAGFRTLDSVVRAKEIFGLNRFTVISQRFHNQRAVFIGRNKGLDVIGYNARTVSRKYGFKTRQREKLARLKMVLDLLFKKKPKFSGEPIEIR
jgi:SanA protein